MEILQKLADEATTSIRPTLDSPEAVHDDPHEPPSGLRGSSAHGRSGMFRGPRMRARGPEVTSNRRRADEIETTGAHELPPEGLLTRLAFGPFTLDPETGRLQAGERIIPLAPKPFETLLYLARRPGRVVSKAELIERLWPDTFVTDDVLVQCVVDIRRALGEPAKSP